MMDPDSDSGIFCVCVSLAVSYTLTQKSLCSSSKEGAWLQEPTVFTAGQQKQQMATPLKASSPTSVYPPPTPHSSLFTSPHLYWVLIPLFLLLTIAFNKPSSLILIFPSSQTRFFFFSSRALPFCSMVWRTHLISLFPSPISTNAHFCKTCLSLSFKPFLPFVLLCLTQAMDKLQITFLSQTPLPLLCSSCLPTIPCSP